MLESSPEPVVSIILPTYNRAKFLPQAFESIRAQTWQDWELIVVDDGSADNSRELIDELTRDWAQPVCYHRQENKGPYGARNTGLDLASGRYVAFFDSDDVWLPHHLKDCVAALDANPDVDWVYAACRIADHATGQVLDPDTFRVKGHARPFQALRSRTAGALRIIDDPGAIRCVLRDGLYCGLQNSVIRRNVFEGWRFESASRNEAEDQLAVVRALAAGYRLGWIDDVHVIYHVHDQNSSAAASNGNLERHLAIYRAVARGLEELGDRLSLTAADRRALRRRLGHEYFWHLGYVLLWEHGRRKEGLAMFARGLRYWPWDWRCWKTYLIARARSWVRSTEPCEKAQPMKSPLLSRAINSLSAGRLKYGWWNSGYCSSEAPIVLGGCSRSGTTLLREILSAHSKLYIGPETAILIGVRDLSHVARVTGLEPGLLRSFYRQSSCLAEFAERVLMELMRTKGRQFWGEKTPANVNHLDTIFRFFPNARFIHILRDGRDVVCSLRTHPTFLWKNGRFVRTGVENPWNQCVREWVEDVKRGLAWRGDSRYMEVRYGCVVSEPERALRPVFSWLGVSWEPAVLEAYKTEEHVNHPGLAESIHQKSRRRWQRDLPADARKLFRGEANDLLIQLGFAKDDAWIEGASNEAVLEECSG